MRLRLASLAALASVALAVTEAAAQAPTADVDALMDQGVRLRSEGRDEDALTAFRRAWDLAHTPEALAQIALAEQALGRWVEAARDLATARESAADPWIARHRDHLVEAGTEIARHVGRVEVRSRSPGARLHVNGVDQGALPLAAPLRMAIGTQSFEVTAPGHIALGRLVDVRPGDDLLEEFDLAPMPATPTVIAPPPGAPRTPRAAPSGWVTASFAAAGAMLVGGAVALAWREVAAADFNAEGQSLCMVDPGDAGRVYGGATCESLASDRGTANALMITGFVAAGAFAATGVALLVARPSARSLAGLRCAPGPGSLVCALRF